MYTLFLVCAVVGSTLLICQFVLALLGVAGDNEFGEHGEFDTEVAAESAGSGHGAAVADDVDGHGHHSAHFLGVLTFRSVVAAMAFFGLAGLAANAAGASDLQVLAVAVGAGGVALWGVHQLMQAISHLQVDGTVQIREAVGQSGNVYLRIPPAAQGVGKVHVMLRQRTVELRAQSADGEIPTGRAVSVVRILAPDLVEVAPLEQSAV